MNLYRALKKNIRKGKPCLSRKSWQPSETVYYERGGPLLVADIKTPPPFKTRSLTLVDYIAKDWY
jgi:hypothetical protein